MKKLLLLSLFCASAQLQGMEQFKKLKKKIRRTYHRVDAFWEEARYIAAKRDDIRHTGLCIMTGNSGFPCGGSFKCVEEKLSSFYGKKVKFNRDVEYLYLEIKRVQNELEEGEEINEHTP